MDFLSLLSFKPLQTAMAYALHLAYASSGSYIVAIAALSVAVNTVLLPLYHLAEKLQNWERAAQTKLRPKIEEIKAVFQGAERFMMMRTLYRQARYHPIYALRSSLGFFVQVPFFIAAYLLLLNYEPFSGKSVPWFGDLERADGLLFGLNLLPILMTLINLASGYVYARELTKSEKYQIWLISLLFFVLLYDSPVSLVLYWTFNNLFSLIKNLLYLRFSDSKEQPSLRDRSLFVAIGDSWQRLRQSWSSRTAKWSWKGIADAKSMKVVLFAFCAERLIYLNFFQTESTQKALFWNAALGSLLAVSLLFSIKGFAALLISWKNRSVGHIAALAKSANRRWTFPLFWFFLFSALTIRANDYFRLSKSLDKTHPEVSSAMTCSITILLLLCGFGIKPFFRAFRRKPRPVGLLVVFGLGIIIAVLLFSWMTGSYSITEPIYIKEALSGALCLLLIVLHYDKIGMALRRLALFRTRMLKEHGNFPPLLSGVLLLALVYNLFILSNGDSSQPAYRFHLWELLLILSLFFAVLLEKAAAYRLTPNIRLYVAASLLLYYSILVAGPMMLYASSLESIHLSKEQLILPHLAIFLQCFGFSLLLYLLVSDAWKKLIIYTLILSSLLGYLYSFVFVGDFGQLDAFKFRNASLLDATARSFVGEAVFVALAAWTVWRLLPRFQKSVLPLLLIVLFGISAFSAVQFVANRSIREPSPSDSDGSLRRIHTYSARQNILVLMLDGFSGIAMDRLIAQNPEIFRQYTGFTWYPNTLAISTSTWGSIAALSAGHRFAPDSINRKRDTTFRQEIADSYLFLPNSFAPHGYDITYVNPQYGSCDRMKGVACYPSFDRFVETGSESMAVKAINMVSIFRAVPFLLKKRIYDNGDWLVDEQKKLSEHTDKLKHWEFVKNMPDNVTLVDDSAKTLKYFQLSIPHAPFVVNEQCDYTNYGDYRSEAKCVLLYIAKLIGRLKREGVYEASKIILVADHGLWHIRGTGRFDREMQEKMRQAERESKENRISMAVVQPLMMVKEFHAGSEPLKTDSTFLSNADVAAMVCAAIEGCPGVIRDPTKTGEKNRKLTVSNAFIDEKRESHGIFDIPDQYEITGNIFEWKNWKKTK